MGTWLEGVVVGVHVAEGPHGARALVAQSVEGTQRWVVSNPPPHHYSDLARRAVLEQLAHLAYWHELAKEGPRDQFQSRLGGWVRVLEGRDVEEQLDNQHH